MAEVIETFGYEMQRKVKRKLKMQGDSFDERHKRRRMHLLGELMNDCVAAIKTEIVQRSDQMDVSLTVTSVRQRLSDAHHEQTFFFASDLLTAPSVLVCRSVDADFAKELLIERLREEGLRIELLPPMPARPTPLFRVTWYNLDLATEEESPQLVSKRKACVSYEGDEEDAHEERNIGKAHKGDQENAQLSGVSENKEQPHV